MGWRFSGCAVVQVVAADGFDIIPTGVLDDFPIGRFVLMGGYTSSTTLSWRRLVHLDEPGWRTCCPLYKISTAGPTGGEDSDLQ